ncbi:O-antigen ligase family protein [Clostridium lundense]|uniref:O-antigen ligase family protein n=1 Tax=Clostridium lundense TaxID=319475 RepID=UPI000484E57D|nr:O-antigen ligase family protein [Clostridium lundense]
MEIYQLILHISIYAYIILMPLIYSKFRLMGVPFNGDILLAFIVLIYILGLLIFRGIRKNFIAGIKKFFTDYLSLSILALILIMAASLTYAENKILVIKETVRFASYIILYFIILCEGCNKRLLDGILRCYIGVSAIIGCIGLYDYFTGIGMVQTETYGSRVRISSTLENSNNLGVFFILIIFPVVMLAIKERNKKKKELYIALSVIFFLNIIFSFSRNAWLAFAIGCGIFAITYSIKFLFVLIPVGGLSLFIPQIAIRIKEIADVSQNTSRIKVWKIAEMIIKDYPGRGIGSGNFPVVSARYMEQKPGLKTQNFIPYHPHNIFLKIQCELGVFGSIAFAAIIVSIGIKLRSFIKNVDDKFYAAFYKGFCISVIAFMITNLVDSFFSAPKVIAFFWISLSVLQSYNIDKTEHMRQIKL